MHENLDGYCFDERPMVDSIMEDVISCASKNEPSDISVLRIMETVRNIVHPSVFSLLEYHREYGGFIYKTRFYNFP